MAAGRFRVGATGAWRLPWSRRCAVGCVAFAVGAAVFGTVGGCVERRILITSEPSGAAVTLNDVDVGLTPLEVDFTYYGVYDVQLRKAGFEPLLTEAEAAAPWYETPGIDIVSQATPPRDRTVIRWHFVLEPLVVDEAGLLGRAWELRGGFE